ncbi:amyotrophic lateral sclerosis 2 chromosomal region candidate gene 12 protein [Otolemur garnettii]|uniref:Flagellum associated containing coiled-coil domains 1 n=1 Tax=Otolemur garnettii TaxID=30611 RepID=H0X3C1_OTOGA|nr:amyotrophic lateral sclerosis 2 chromosomal region candidate gene 12 protein [Otolemur garnettii]
MNFNPLIYCTCWDPWNSGPRKLIKTPRPPNKTLARRSKPTPLLPALEKYSCVQPTKPCIPPKVKFDTGKQESNKSPYEVIDVSPGYQLCRNREQISVTLGEEMFDRKKRLDSEVMDKVQIARTDIISDLEEQISELMAAIEQMNRDHQSAQKLLSSEMDLRCVEMKQNFENKNRELKVAHDTELSELENNYKTALKEEKLAAQKKLEEMEKEYKYLKNMFYMYQDSIYDEMEDKWLKRKAEWEKDEKLEREKILLQQKNKMTKKFELESEEERKKINESYNVLFENFIREKEELLKQHDSDNLQIEELKKTKTVIEEELHAQALILESLNTNLYHVHLELQREKASVGNLEKMFQTKLAEAEEKYKSTIQTLTEENNYLRQKLTAKEEEMSDALLPGNVGSSTTYEYSDILEDGNNKKEDS